MSVDPKTGLLLGALLLTAPVFAAPTTHSGRLHLADGSVAEGTLLALKEGRPQFSDSTNRSKPRAFIFDVQTATNAVERPRNRAELHDGSSISGRLLSVTDEEVVVDPLYADPMTLRRGAVRSLRWTDQAAGVAYEGLYNTNRWIISPLAVQGAETKNPSWKLTDGMFVSQGRGTLACEVEMPTISRVEFDLHWRKIPRFRMAFYARDTHHYSFSEGYRFYSPGHGIIFAMTRSMDPKRSVELSKAPVPALVERNFVHLDFRLNTQSGEGWLFADGKEVRHWTDLGYSGSGTALIFYNFKKETRLGIANLRVSQWDGRTAHDPKPSTGDTSFIFKNGDSVETDQFTFRGTNLTFRYQGSWLTIPESRVTQIFLPGAPQTAKEESVWIQFQRGDWMRAQLLALTDTTVTCRHPSGLTKHQTILTNLRGLHFSQQKPVMDLSWYLPTMSAPSGKP
ncbi:MAG: hypothetical protein ACPGVU_11505 [Limisphaerales bacterium]